MIPAPFGYVRATSLSHAIALLQDDPDGSKLIAGGHTLIPTLKLRLASPALLIDIRTVEELKGIDIGERIRIGALTTHAELLACGSLHEILPIFRQAADIIADPQVRNRGTIGGSLANADPAADWPAVIIALNAELQIAGPKGRRRVAARDFFVGIFTTLTDPSEVIAAIHIPHPLAGTQFRYRKIRHPASGYAVVGVALAICTQGGVVTHASIGITGAAAHAFAAEAATQFLTGKPLTRGNIDEAARLACEPAEYLSDHYASSAYRQHLARTEVARALASINL